MNKWILSQIAMGLPYGVAFEADPPAGDPPPADPPADPPAVPPAGDPAPWAYAEGVAGEGDVPEWFKGDKYASVADQAKAYKELEGKFGAFTGAPEAYELTTREELKEKGVEFDAEDPMIVEAMEYAKTAGMDQEGFNGLLDLYGMVRVAETEAAEAHKADEMKALGQNGQGRIDNIVKWANANLSEEQVAGLNAMANSAEAVKTIEHLITLTNSAPISPNGEASPGGITEAELKEMQFAEDDHGNRKIQTDKAFKAEYDKKMELFYGSGDHTIVVGKK